MAALNLVNIPWLYTCDDRRKVLRAAWISVREGAIHAIGHAGEAMPPASETIDLSGCIVVPGFVNLHHHFFQSLTRALPGAQRGTALEWLATLYPLWARMTPRESRIATNIAAAELLLSGCTTSVDHAYLVPGGEETFLHEEIEAAREIGLRLHLVVGGVPTLEGDLAERLHQQHRSALERLVQSESEVLALMRAMARRYHDRAVGSMTQIVLGPVGVSYERPQLMTQVADIAQDHECGLHTHLHPRPDERSKASQLIGCGPVDLLRRAGWMRQGTWFAHGSQLRDDEMQAFADAEVGLAHCPHTIPRLGFPLTRIDALRRIGVRVGFGTDGSASNDHGSLLADVRLGLIMHRIGTASDVDVSSAWLTPEDALWMATRDGAAILRRSDIGAIVPGMRADIAAFKLDLVDYAGALTDPLGALLMAGSWSRATLTMVDGRVVVRDSKLTAADEGDIATRGNSSIERLLAAMSTQAALAHAQADAGRANGF